MPRSLTSRPRSWRPRPRRPRRRHTQTSCYAPPPVITRNYWRPFFRACGASLTSASGSHESDVRPTSATSNGSRCTPHRSSQSWLTGAAGWWTLWLRASREKCCDGWRRHFSSPAATNWLSGRWRGLRRSGSSNPRNLPFGASHAPSNMTRRPGAVASSPEPLGRPRGEVSRQPAPGAPSTHDVLVIDINLGIRYFTLNPFVVALFVAGVVIVIGQGIEASHALDLEDWAGT